MKRSFCNVTGAFDVRKTVIEVAKTLFFVLNLTGKDLVYPTEKTVMTECNR